MGHGRDGKTTFLNPGGKGVICVSHQALTHSQVLSLCIYSLTFLQGQTSTLRLDTGVMLVGFKEREKKKNEKNKAVYIDIFSRVLLGRRL